MDAAAPPEAVDSRGRRYELLPRAVRVVSGSGRARTLSLRDPADPTFLRLPDVDLDDGRSLRRAGFEEWAAGVRDALAGGASFETTHRSRRPYTTALAMTGAALVVAAGLGLLGLWSSRPPERIGPTPAGAAAVVVAVGLVLWVVAEAAVAFARAWLCRRGSFVHVELRGLRTEKGRMIAPFDVVGGVRYAPWLRCTRIEFADRRRPPMWVPREPGPLRRLDLVLRALHPELGGPDSPPGLAERGGGRNCGRT